MSEDVERTVGNLTIRIDHSLCVGFAHCVEEAPDAFRLDEDGIVQFAQPETVSREDLVTACEVCPVDALSGLDPSGEQVVP